MNLQPESEGMTPERWKTRAADLQESARRPSPIEAMDRVWAVTWELEYLLGHTRPSVYVAERLQKLWRHGRATDVDAMCALAERLEARVSELTGAMGTDHTRMKAVG